MPNFQLANRKREQPLQLSSGIHRTTFGRRLIRGSVRIGNDVDDWVVKLEGVESKFGAEHGDELYPSNQPVDMRVGNFTRLFASVNGQIAYVDLEAEWNGMKTAQLHTSTGHSLQLSHEPMAHHGLKGIGGDVPGKDTEQN